MAKPILKWAGGKRQIINEVLAHFPRDYKDRRFHEPMFGAGAITFRIEPKSGSINDVNRRLINLYRIVRDSPEELIENNKQHIHSEEYFYQARERFNAPIRGESLDPIEEASLLIYLNRTCFNGLYRENSKGGFNVPYGRYKTVDFIQEDNIRNDSAVLKRLEIHNKDFSYVLNSAKPGDLVYFDPPYQPVSNTSSFTSYHMEGFDLKDQERLRDLMVKLNDIGIAVVLSNSSAEEVRALYSELEKDSFTITGIQANRAINCDGQKRGSVGELIVTNVRLEERILRLNP